MTIAARGPAARLFLTTVLLLCALAAPCRHAAAQDPAGTGHVKQKLNVDFSFPPADWSFHPAGSDYFSDFKEMKMSLFATSNGCAIDAFVMLDGERVGFLGTYMVSLQDFFANRGAETDEQYEIWRGEQGRRVVGKLVIQGPADKAGTMRSRAAGSSPYRNVIYMILNNMNLMRLAFSAPVRDWNDPACTARIDRVVNSFMLKGDPDPREERVINGMGSRITADRTKDAPAPSLKTNTPAPIADAGGGDPPAPAVTKNPAPDPGNSAPAPAPSEDKLQAILDRVDAIAARLSNLETDQKKLLKQLQELREQVERDTGTEPE